MEVLKSPCFDCICHKRKLDKLDPRYNCEECRPRLEYAVAVTGIPARFIDDDVYEVHHDGTDLFNVFADGLNISDISYY